ncbi:MAG: UDP-2,3-diacylglucosamine diphosphatase [Rikenellaceae bacterium]
MPLPADNTNNGESAEPTKYKTIVISDVHLGSKWSAAKEATRFIKQNSCDTLILCGDIIDGWAILRGSGQKWKRRHTNFVSAILDLPSTTKVIYIRGNHDDFLERLIPLEFLNICVKEDMIYESFGKKYYVLHGDVFDKVTSGMSWLAKLGDIGYSMLLWYNRIHNHRRIRKGLPYESFARKVKNKVKASVSYISDFEAQIADLARAKGCDGVICGHIHHPEITDMKGIKYLNSGDWVESLSALTQDHDGNWELYLHEKPSNLLEKIEERKKQQLIQQEDERLGGKK